MAGSPTVGQVVSVRIDPTLRRQIQAYIALHGFGTVAEGLRTLIIRGFFLELKPRGKFSESAWIAAYYQAKGTIQATLYKTLTGPPMDRLIDQAFREAFAGSGELSIDVPPG